MYQFSYRIDILNLEPVTSFKMSRIPWNSMQHFLCMCGCAFFFWKESRQLSSESQKNQWPQKAHNNTAVVFKLSSKRPPVEMWEIWANKCSLASLPFNWSSFAFNFTTHMVSIIFIWRKNLKITKITPLIHKY